MPRSSRNSTSSTTSSASSTTPTTPPTLTSLQHRWQSFEQYVQTPAATTNIVDTLRTCPKTSKRWNNRPTNSINSGWPCWTPLLRSNAAAHVFIVTCTVGEPKSNRYAHHGRSRHRVRHITPHWAVVWPRVKQRVNKSRSGWRSLWVRTCAGTRGVWVCITKNEPNKGTI